MERQESASGGACTASIAAVVLMIIFLVLIACSVPGYGYIEAPVYPFRVVTMVCLRPELLLITAPAWT